MNRQNPNRPYHEQRPGQFDQQANASGGSFVQQAGRDITNIYETYPVRPEVYFVRQRVLPRWGVVLLFLVCGALAQTYWLTPFFPMPAWSDGTGTMETWPGWTTAEPPAGSGSSTLLRSVVLILAPSAFTVAAITLYVVLRMVIAGCRHNPEWRWWRARLPGRLVASALLWWWLADLTFTV